MPGESQNLPAVNCYTPVEIIGIYRSYIERGKTNNVVWLRGIYSQKPNQNRAWATAYDELRDVNTNTTVTLKLNWQDRDRLKNNSLVQIGGLIDINISPFANGTIQIALQVTRFEIIKDQFVTEEELKRNDLKQQKNAAHYKNATAEIGQVLFEGKRPKIALIIAQGTRTQGDFEDGLRSARSAIDFDEYRCTLSQTPVLCNTLRTLDAKGYTAIAIYRGGGIDSRQDVDKLEVLQVVVVMKTPFISGVGHLPEQIFLRQVADAWTATPQGLGQFFSEIVENVAAKRSNSRAVLVEEVKKQFAQQIADSNKKYRELVEQIDKITKANEKAQKEQTEQLGKLREQLKTQTEQNAKQAEKFNASIKKMQETNGELTKSLQRMNAQNVQTSKDLNEAREQARQLERQLEEALQKHKGCSSGCLGFVAAAVSVAGLACWGLCLIL